MLHLPRSLQIWFLLLLGGSLGLIVGTFLVLVPAWGVLLAWAIATLYCLAFYYWQRRAVWWGMGVTVAVVAGLTRFASVIDFIAAYLPSLLYLIFGEAGMHLRVSRDRRSTFYILLSATVGPLYLGWWLASWANWAN
mgnify:CR=1 FL=1